MGVLVMADLQVVIFALNNELCGVSTSIVHKIEKFGEVAHIPGMPDYIEGLFNLRGRVVPVVSLNKRFGMGDTEINKKTKIIITEKDSQLYGFVVNNVIEIIGLDNESIDTSDSILHLNSRSYLRGVGKKDGKLFSIIDLNCILDEAEITEVNKAIENK
jgi:purine-binding chemotaxis protein CheW